MDACLRDRDAVQGAVELAVAAAVEPVALVLAAACFEWCDAGVAGELGVGVEAFDRADLAEQLRGAERAAAGQGKQRRRGLLDPGLELAVEGEDRAGQRAAAADELACDPHLHRLLAATQPAGDPVEPNRAVEAARRDRQLGIEVEQLPAQPLLRPPPLIDEVVTVVDKQLQPRVAASPGRG